MVIDNQHRPTVRIQPRDRVQEHLTRDWLDQVIRDAQGACCFMHTRLLHGSAPNHSDHPRTLFIAVYTAEDAVPLSPNPVPSSMEGMVVAGERTGKVRSVDFELRLPQLPRTASFFDQQATAAAGAGAGKDYTF